MSRRSRWDGPEGVELRKRWDANERARDLAVHFRTSPGAIYQAAAKLGLKTRTLPRGPGRPARRDPADRHGRDPTKQRRFAGYEHDDQRKRIVLQPHHPASREGATIFPTTVIPASKAVRILKSGEWSRKLGALIEKGAWKGMPMWMLTLEERETCPRTCLEWASCYGNNMHQAQRISDDGTLIARLWGELASLSAATPGGFVVRLHVLGDFYSVDYVRAWRRFLSDFPPLHVFGFTARRPADPIGAELVHLVADEPDRFKLRFSGAGYETHCAEVVDRPDQATGIICPAETDRERCCATCALCIQTDRTITFLRH